MYWLTSFPPSTRFKVHRTKRSITMERRAPLGAKPTQNRKGRSSSIKEPLTIEDESLFDQYMKSVGKQSDDKSKAQYNFYKACMSRAQEDWIAWALESGNSAEKSLAQSYINHMKKAK